MIRGFSTEGGRLLPLAEVRNELERAVWIDMLEPTPDDEALLETAIGLDVPTREEMEEIEISSRLYVEDGAVFMTALLPSKTDTDEELMAAVTFVLARDKLVTVRYHSPRAFHTFPQRAEKVSVGCSDSASVLLGLLDAIVDRLADVLERAQRDIDTTSRNIFSYSDTKPAVGDQPKPITPLQRILQDIGRRGALVSNIGNSLLTLRRVAGFLTQVMSARKNDKELRSRVRTLARDVQSLTDHSEFLSQKVTFLLDATLGMINIEQNATIRIFSVLAVVLLPPTVIASLYGMNFRHLPVLDWLFGYPFALLLMVLAAVVPYLFFKWRRWL